MCGIRSWHLSQSQHFKNPGDVRKNCIYLLLASAEDWPPEEHLSLSPSEEDTDGS